MSRSRIKRAFWVVIPLTLLAHGDLAAQPLGSAITYQGQLKELGQPANGLYDLQACLFDTPSNPIPLACAPDLEDVPVEGGLFAITLDFGSAPFVGQQRHLELRVRPGSSGGAYTTLSPRQVLRPAPEALRSNVSAAAPWSGLTGVPNGFADAIDNDSGGTVTNVMTGPGLTGGPITGAGVVSIANNGVTSAMIASGAVGPVQLATDSVTSAHIVDATITATDLAPDSVTATQVAANAVDTNAIIDANVTTAKIAAGAVGAAQIDSSQVQRRISTTCPTDQYIRSISESGVATCGPISPPPPPPPTQGSNTNTTISNSGAVLLSDVTIGQDGLPLVALAESPYDTKLVKCQNLSCSTRFETIAQNVSPSSVSRRIGLTVLTDGRPVIALGNASGILYIICSSAPTCGTLQQIGPITTEGFSSVDMILADDGFPLIAGISESGKVKTIKCLGEYCSPRNEVTHASDAAFAAGGEISLASTSGLPPAVAYRATGSDAAKMFRCSNVTCTQPTASVHTFASGLFVGQRPSIALPPDGRPIIAHYDAQNFNLLVTRCGDASCATGNSTQAVHSAGTVGFSPAIVLAQGFPVIAYLESSTPRVLVARCTQLDCSANTGFATVQTLSNFQGMINITLSPEERPIITYLGQIVRCANVGCG